MGKHALILPAGGAKGRWQAGVIHALHDRGYRWDIIIGISVGSINGATYGLLGPERLTELWATEVRSQKDILSPSGIWKYIKGPFNLMFRGGIYNLNPVKNILVRNLTGRSPILCDDVYVCKISVRTGKVVYAHHSEEDFIESILGSSSIPGVIQPTGEWADGVLNERSVLKKAITHGADKITVIMCDQFTQGDLEVDKKIWFGSAFKNVLGMANVIANELTLSDIGKCHSYNEDGSRKRIGLEVFAPLGHTVGTLEFGPKDPYNIWKRGYNVGMNDPVFVSGNSVL